MSMEKPTGKWLVPDIDKMLKLLTTIEAPNAVAGCKGMTELVYCSMEVRDA